MNTSLLLLSVDETLDQLAVTNSRRNRLKQQARDAHLREMKNGSFEVVLPDLGERSVWLEFADADIFLVNEVDWLGRTLRTDTAPLGADRPDKGPVCAMGSQPSRQQITRYAKSTCGPM